MPEIEKLGPILPPKDTLLELEEKRRQVHRILDIEVVRQIEQENEKMNNLIAQWDNGEKTKKEIYEMIQDIARGPVKIEEGEKFPLIRKLQATEKLVELLKTEELSERIVIDLIYITETEWQEY